MRGKREVRGRMEERQEEEVRKRGGWRGEGTIWIDQLRCGNNSCRVS